MNATKQIQSRVYLSAIRDLQDPDAEEKLKKKREQQIAFAESLRKQIEEKRQRQQQINQKRNINQQFKDSQRNEPHFTFGKEMDSAKIASSSNQSYFQTKGPISNEYGNEDDLDFSFSMKFESLSNKNEQNTSLQSNKYDRTRKQIFTKADLSQFNKYSSSSSSNSTSNNYTFCRPGAIKICTDSPFASSTVQTPPQGFSMRSHSSVQPTNFQQDSDEAFKIMNSRFDNYDVINSDKVINGCTQKPFTRTQQKNLQPKFNFGEDIENLKITSNINTGLSSTVTKKINYRPPQVHPRAKSMLLQPVEKINATQLNGTSELVYPDGHLSPAVSSRDT